MKGVIRSQVMQFFPDAVTDIVTVKVPYDKLHVFEVQIFFPPNVPYKWANTPGDAVTGIQFDPADKNVISYKQPLRFYNDPTWKRSDQWQFVRISGSKNYPIIAVLSYIDQG